MVHSKAGLLESLQYEGGQLQIIFNQQDTHRAIISLSSPPDSERVIGLFHETINI
jgi:hypothetical protein